MPRMYGKAAIERLKQSLKRKKARLGRRERDQAATDRAHSIMNIERNATSRASTDQSSKDEAARTAGSPTEEGGQG